MEPAAVERIIRSIVPIRGEFAAFAVGVATGAFHHSSQFGLGWERDFWMLPMQRLMRRLPGLASASHFFGMFADELIVPYFAALYWLLDKHKCVYGIFLVPVSELANGALKWYFRVPRPSWIDDRVMHRGSWSHEYSFPSSHSQIIWALAHFFSQSSTARLRRRLFGATMSRTALMSAYLLVAPYAFAAAVAASRVFLGVHYPRDISVGAGIGVGLAAMHIQLLPRVKRTLKRAQPLTRIAALQLFALLIGLANQSARRRAAAAVAKRGQVDNGVLEDWAERAGRSKDREKKVVEHRYLDPIGEPAKGYLGQTGVLAGLGLSVSLLASRADIARARSSARGGRLGVFMRLAEALHLPLPTGWAAGSARMVLGLAGLMAVFLSARAREKELDRSAERGERKKVKRGLLPVMMKCLDAREWTSNPAVIRYLRHAFVPIYILIFAPLAFKRLGI
jgi:membrane-associated phospholipid phosphatase